MHSNWHGTESHAWAAKPGLEARLEVAMATAAEKVPAAAAGGGAEGLCVGVRT